MFFFKNYYAAPASKIALKLHQNPPFLASLSACSTAKNQVERLLDEGIHLMAVCQLAGFPHVIGSLWEVSDSHCVDVAKDVYDTSLQSGLSDESASRGLHRAVLNLRKGPGADVPATREAQMQSRLGAVGRPDQESPISDPRNCSRSFPFVLLLEKRVEDNLKLTSEV
jgi:CHAT domain-containing protein